MKNFFFLIVLVSVWLISRFTLSPCGGVETLRDSEALAALGLIIILGHLTGRFFRRFGTPQVTGYMIIGILSGSYFWNIFGFSGVLSLETIDRIQLIDKIALVLIALTAGGELRVGELKKIWKSITSILLLQTIVVLALSVGAMFVIGKYFLPVGKYSLIQTLALGLLVGTMMTANSPSVAIAVISELKAKGPVSNMVMAVTVPKDVVVIILFAISMAFCQSVFKHIDGFSESGHSLPFSLSVSVLVGIAGGLALTLYLKYVNKQIELAVLVLTIALIKVINIFSLELLFTAVIMGFIVENFSEQGDRLIRSLEKVSPPIYILFFTIAGANINLKLVTDLLLITLVWVAIRSIGIWGGTKLGLMSGKMKGEHDKYIWMGYLPQAGVAMGMTAVVASMFPSIGKDLRTLILAVIGINQILGPIAFRWALQKSGEVGAKDR